MSKDPTHSLMKWIVENSNVLAKPLKLYTVSQDYWNSENHSIGAQCTMDVIGVKSVTAEADLICAYCDFLKVILSDHDEEPSKRNHKRPKFSIRINNRAFLQLVLDHHNFAGDRETFNKILSILNQLNTLPLEDVKGKLLALRLNDSGIISILQILSVNSLEEMAEVIGQEHSSIEQVKQLFKLIESYGYSEYVQFDPKITRGLEYYSGIVFEAFDAQNQMIGGGGRYDVMSLHTGATQQTPAVGFGVDLENFMLKQKNLLKRKYSPGIDDLIVPYREENRDEANEIIALLRKSNRKADIVLKENQALGKSFSYASRRNAARVILVSSKEGSGMYRVKYKKDGREFVLSKEELLTFSPPEQDEMEKRLIALQEVIVEQKNDLTLEKLNTLFDEMLAHLKKKGMEFQSFSTFLARESNLPWNSDMQEFESLPDHRSLTTCVRSFTADYSQRKLNGA
eukprot:CAMPEP_0117445762 /NCGR_PEP_ID=MMETSP0759-20121206/5971_1 /TAXON_ID=63605 /ORGANISM="Percolomonas cosmopolitus, Strain WS" /LENGTH=454 /DNA_ID=CAMNT_0005237965 /DNA_START=369 /DNA_END=1733 /DNA_ORIENTATION=-